MEKKSRVKRRSKAVQKKRLMTGDMPTAGLSEKPLLRSSSSLSSDPLTFGVGRNKKPLGAGPD